MRGPHTKSSNISTTQTGSISEQPKKVESRLPPGSGAWRALQPAAAGGQLPPGSSVTQPAEAPPEAPCAPPFCPADSPLASCCAAAAQSPASHHKCGGDREVVPGRFGQGGCAREAWSERVDQRDWSREVQAGGFTQGRTTGKVGLGWF